MPGATRTDMGLGCVIVRAGYGADGKESSRGTSVCSCVRVGFFTGFRKIHVRKILFEICIVTRMSDQCKHMSMTIQRRAKATKRFATKASPSFCSEFSLFWVHDPTSVPANYHFAIRTFIDYERITPAPLWVTISKLVFMNTWACFRSTDIHFTLFMPYVGYLGSQMRRNPQSISRIFA